MQFIRFMCAFSGCFAALFPVILVDLLGIDMIEKSLGQALACASIGFLLASPMSGTPRPCNQTSLCDL